MVDASVRFRFGQPLNSGRCQAALPEKDIESRAAMLLPHREVVGWLCLLHRLCQRVRYTHRLGSGTTLHCGLNDLCYDISGILEKYKQDQ